MNCRFYREVRGRDKMKNGIFSEGGWIAAVKVLEDNSDNEWERYNLEVIKTIQESAIFKTPVNGWQFEVSADRKYRAYVDWELEVSI